MTGATRARRRSGRIVRARAHETTAHDPPCEAKRDARGDERETKEETREVATRGCAEVFLRFVEFSHEERPCGAGAVDLVEHGRTGTEHPVSVAGVGGDVEGSIDRPLSESAPRSLASGPTGIDPGGAPFGTPPVRNEGESSDENCASRLRYEPDCRVCTGRTSRHGRGDRHCPHHGTCHVRLGKDERPGGPSRESKAKRPSDASHRHEFESHGPSDPGEGARTGKDTATMRGPTTRAWARAASRAR